MKVGILGGSFDPIHNGHMNMAKSALNEFKLDEVWLMPAAHSPNKDECKMTSFSHRYRMCELACINEKSIVTSDFENQTEEKSYTYRTLQRLKETYPNNDFYFIMGADSIDYFDRWIHPEIIASLCTILVIDREEFSKDKITNKIKELKTLFDCNIYIVNCDRVDVSSSEIRSKLSNNEAVSELICCDVAKYIKENKIYDSIN